MCCCPDDPETMPAPDESTAPTVDEATDLPEDDGRIEDGPEALEARNAELAARVADLEQQVDQEHAQALRTLADFQNFRRRNEEQRLELVQFANRELALGLLPIIDNLERAMAAAVSSQSYEAMASGVALIARQLQDYLKKSGVEPIEAVGQEFDPNVHEAVVRVDDPEHAENTVVDELQRGYTMHGRVLRPSMVRVAGSNG